MPVTGLIQNLSLVALVLEIIHRGIIAITNLLRMFLSPKYRSEIFDAELQELAPA